jgi:DNA-binding response OmpR family regulator
MAKRILLVDESKEASRALQGLLEAEGYEVTTGPRGEAEALVAACPSPDLILMDVSGEGEEGYRRCRTLREHFPEAAIILMAGATLAEAERTLGLEAGADGFLPRPENLPEIVDSIAERLGAHRAAGSPGVAGGRGRADRAACPECGLAVRVSPGAVKGGRAKVACPQCNSVFVVAAESLRPGGGPAVQAKADRGKLILVVEDTDFFRTYVSELLEEAGFRVEAVKDGYAALEFLGRARPDLVLTDLLLPGIHGFDLCRQVKERTAPRPVPVVMMTGVYKSLQYQVEAQLRYQADDFLVKPFNPEDLITRLLRVLERSAA